MSGDIERLQKELNALRQDLEDLKNQIFDQNRGIDNLKSDVSTLQHEVAYR